MLYCVVMFLGWYKLFGADYWLGGENAEDGAEKAAWLRDQLVKACMNCNKDFTVTRRRHHCRKWYVPQ